MRAATESPGRALRAAREQRGWSVPDAAALLSARSQDLRALEWDRLDLLDPATAGALVDAYVALLESGEPPRPAAAEPAPAGRGLLRAVAEPLALGTVVVGIALAGVTAAEVIPSRESEPTFAPATASGGSGAGTSAAMPAAPAGGPPADPEPASPPTIEATPPTVATTKGGDASSTVPPAPRTGPATTASRPEPTPPPPTQARPPAAQPAARIGGIAASPSGSAVTVVWHTIGAVPEVLVYRRVGDGAERLVYRGGGKRFVDSALQPGMPHRYRVVGIDARGVRTQGLAVTVQPS